MQKLSKTKRKKKIGEIEQQRSRKDAKGWKGKLDTNEQESENGDKKIKEKGKWTERKDGYGPDEGKKGGIGGTEMENSENGEEVEEKRKEKKLREKETNRNNGDKERKGNLRRKQKTEAEEKGNGGETERKVN